MMLACAVCFTGADGLMRESLNAGIFVLMAVTAVVLACFAAFFVRLAARARANAHLVDEGGGLPIASEYPAHTGRREGALG